MAAFAHPVPESYRTESQPSNHRPLAKLLCYRSLCCDLEVSTGGSVRIVAAYSAISTKSQNQDPAHSSMVAPFTRSLRSEEHTSELKSLMRISYADCCLKKTT